MNHPRINHARNHAHNHASWANWSYYLVLVVFISGCSHIPTLGTASEPVTAVRPQQNVAALLAQRLDLCAQEKTLRAERLRGLRGQLLHPRKGDPSSIDDKLQGLMLTSCEPANTPGLMGEVLNHLVGLGDWPADYNALFDLLRSEQRALNQFSARAQENARENAELRQALQTQKAELNKLQGSYKETIKGIGEIEETLDSRKQKPPSPP